MNTYEIFFSIFLLSIAFLFVYHHAFFPLILRWKLRRVENGEGLDTPFSEDDMPLMTIFMPAYNEATHIAEKLRNLASLDYPKDKIRIVVVCDGCTDDTVALARVSAGEAALRKITVRIINEPENLGKIAVLNKYLPTIRTGLIAISDVSADISTDAFKQAAAHFVRKNIGVVAATYRLSNVENIGESTYWKYQVLNKRGEAAFGAPLGVHGALYFIRSGTFQALEPDTINDDFILPMRIVVAGYQSIYDANIIATEQEVADQNLDFNRRVRISAGNIQQIIRVPQLMSPKRSGIAFAFLSGKALRAIMPFLLAVFMVGTAVLSITLIPWRIILALEIMTILLTGARHFLICPGKFKLLDIIHYIVLGHIAGLLGGARYLFSTKMNHRTPSSQTKDEHVMRTLSFEPKSISIAKRTLDIVGALIGLGLSLPLLVPVYMAIKMDSKGPIVFRQVRVGRAWPNFTELFTMYKFRTMRVDAEAISGPVWATKNDPRITAVGRFLRKTRMDEIPQLINVLKGDMSLVGPRPERPGICDKLERAIPYYAERTYGVRPGITGLAQVFQGYDETIEDVRSKVSYDHAYALAKGSWKTWLLLDLEILARTVTVVIFGRGQ